MNALIFLALGLFTSLAAIFNRCYGEVILEAHSLQPNIVVQTEPVGFSMAVSNTGDVSVTLNPETALSFSDGATTYTANARSAVLIDAGTTTTVPFALQPIPPAFVPGVYTPAVACRGTDGGGTSFTQTLLLTPNCLEVKPNMGQLAEVAGVNWPREPSNLALYPYLIRLSNVGPSHVAIDQRSRIAITDGTRLYAAARLALDATLIAGQSTKIEFQNGDFTEAPAGPYQAVITVIGPAYSQTMILDDNPILVRDRLESGSMGVSPAEGIFGISTTTDTTREIYTCGRGNVGEVGDLLWTFAYGQNTATPGRFSSPTFCDIDGDGDLDFLAGGEWGNITLVGNTGAPPTPSWATPTAGYESIRVGGRSSPAFADIDGDADPDLFLGDDSGRLFFYRNLSTPTSGALWAACPRLYPSIDVGSDSRPAFVDIDADGDLDLFVGCADGTLWHFANTGTANLPHWATGVPCAGIDVGDYSAPAFTDIDGDGDKDLFLGCGDGTLSYVENVGNAAAPAWGAVVSSYAGIDVGDRAAPALADIDGDGDFDLFVGRQGNEGIVFYRNTGGPSSPIWTQESFSPTYMKPPTAPPFFQPDAAWNDTALITNPYNFFVPFGGNGVRFWVSCHYTPDALLGVEYTPEFVFSNGGTPKPPGGGGIGITLSIYVHTSVGFDDDCEVVIPSIASSTPNINRSEVFTVNVQAANPKLYRGHWDNNVYRLRSGFDTSNCALAFAHGAQDVSEKFSVSLVNTPTWNADGATTLTFTVTPGNDAPLGEIVVDPMVATHAWSRRYRAPDPGEWESVEMLSARNRGSEEWPTSSVLTLNLVGPPGLMTDTSALAVPEGATASFGVCLFEQPSGNAEVTVDRVSGDSDITVQSGSILTFTAANWSEWQTVTVAAQEDIDTSDDSAVIRCSSGGCLFEDIVVTEMDNDRPPSGINDWEDYD